mmetsp:Transcript_29361/g.41083  ORF Transcript_29361/g.41083 Transcript_29361/m.41083 type:complete len:116 (+) Transcript_29361:920-1267(+)
MIQPFIQKCLPDFLLFFCVIFKYIINDAAAAKSNGVTILSSSWFMTTSRGKKKHKRRRNSIKQMVHGVPRLVKRITPPFGIVSTTNSENIIEAMCLTVQQKKRSFKGILSHLSQI